MDWILLFCIFGFFVFVVYHIVKYRNPYKLYMIFGKKGSGKSTLLTKLAIRHKRKGWTVYSTEAVPGAYLVKPEDIGYCYFEPNSVLLVDEVGMVFDNRNFKNFKPEVRDWFKLQRHYGVKVYLFSQAFDIDKKIRDLTDNMYLVRNWFNCFSVARKINRRITIVHADNGGTGESHLADDMDFTHWLTIPFGGAIFTWIPAWSKYFNSFAAPELPHKDFVYYDERSDLYHVSVLSRWISSCKRCFGKFMAVLPFGRFHSETDQAEDGLPLSEVSAEADEAGGSASG